MDQDKCWQRKLAGAQGVPSRPLRGEREGGVAPLSRCEVGLPLAKVIIRRELEARGRRTGSTYWTLSVGLANASP